MKKLLKDHIRIEYAIIFFLAAIDQIIKNYIIKINDFKITEFLSIIFVKNTGAGFGFFKGMTFFLVIVSILFIIFAVYYINKGEKKYKIPIAVMCAGAIGNLIDRINYGYVIDFIDIHYSNYIFPTFNFADIYLTIGAILLIVIAYKK